LVLQTYRLTAPFPKAEIYGLTSQMRRAAVSIPANVAEGTGRAGLGEFIQFLHIALGSAKELEYYGVLARDLTWIDEPTYHGLSEQIGEVLRMLNGLILSLEKKRNRD
ncbi:MAG: four helix bundle protein, partial [Anaerolineae bacterium]|nr:four helix bundle protein [Anaerolineae bacterium]